MITLLLIAMMCLSIFSGLETISKLALGTAIRSEAYHLLQAEAERLTAADFGSFAAMANQTSASCLKTTFAPGNQAQFAYPATGSQGRVTFTRRVVDVTSTATTKTLRVEVQWAWRGRSYLISTLVFRTI
jgi:hypothetical protein